LPRQLAWERLPNPKTFEADSFPPGEGWEGVKAMRIKGHKEILQNKISIFFVVTIF
jgi:hypothetical protein